MPGLEAKRGLKQKRSYTTLASAQATINGLVLAGMVGLYLLRPSVLQGPIQPELLTGLALFGLLYFFGFHPILRRLHQGTSTLFLTLITTANIVLLMLETGGLDSPFYSLWLLAIVTSGIFGTVYTILILAMTILVHVIAFAQHGFEPAYVLSHTPQLAVSMLAAGLAELVYYRGASTQKEVVASLSGQLGEEQLKAQVLMSSMADGVIVVDGSKKIRLLNKAAQDMTGWDDQSARGLDYHLVLKLLNAAGKEIGDANDPFTEAWIKNTSVVHSDFSCQTKAERKIALSISVSPIYNQSREITGGIAVFRDISREKEVERTRNEFISTASHEMRTPVAATEGYISLAMNPKVAAIDDRAMGYLQKAHDNTQHLGALFRDLLSVTKIDEGLIAKNMAPVNLTQMLQDIANDMQFAASKKGLSITFMGSSSAKTLTPSFWAMVDLERLREVVLNLIENGMKFTKEGGITLSISGDEKTITVKVQDTGIGIATEDVSHLFQKFYRVDNSATRTIGGTGLGLYLCRTLVELFNGRIWVESVVGEGSSFNFTLPRIAEPAEAPARAAAALRSKAAPVSAAPALVAVAVKPEPIVLLPEGAGSQLPAAAVPEPVRTSPIKVPVAAQ